MDSSTIRKLRKYLGATQREFGYLVGVSKQSIVAWELGVTIPSRVAVNSILHIEMNKGQHLVELARRRENAVA